MGSEAIAHDPFESAQHSEGAKEEKGIKVYTMRKLAKLTTTSTA
jgi:hypothetical protein